jgi:aryl-alcohol dehydrogenase-like predicted oxidoreductase
VKQVAIAGTSLQVSRLSFGTASLHHLLTRRARQRLLGHACERGFSHFDTAPLYGHGLAEEELGVFLASGPRALTVATKLGLYPPRWSRPRASWVWAHQALARVLPRLSKPIVSWSLALAERSLERSLRRLRRGHVDVLFLHEPDPGLLAADELLRWLERQRAAGKVRYHGVAGDARRVVRWIRGDHALCQVLQLRDSIARREADVAREAGRELQFTFGYLAARRGERRALGVSGLVQAALRRTSGSVLVASRALAHVDQLSALAREAPACI